MEKRNSIILYIFATVATLALAGSGYLFWKSNFFDRANVSIQARTLTTKKECVSAFGRAGRRILGRKKARLYPIEITIENKGNQGWKLSPENIGLKMASPKRVAKRMKSGPLTQAFLQTIGAGFKFAAFRVFGATIIGVCNPPLALTLSVPYFIGQAILGFKGLMAPIVGYSQAEETNQKVEQYISDTSLTENIVVQPLEKTNLYLFVNKKDHKEKFSLALVNGKGNQKQFELYAPLY